MPVRVRDRSNETPDADSPPPSQTSTPNGRHGLAMRQRADARSVSGSKRKRANTMSTEPSNNRRRTVDRDVESDASDYDSEDGDVYDPDQPAHERRQVQRGLRDLLKGISEHSEEYLQKDSRGLHDTILKANELSKQLKQTSEATIDSRLLVSTTDLSYRKTLRLTQGSISQGIDVDEFVSKAITFMRTGAGIEDDDAPELSSTQQHRRRRASHHRRDGVEEEDDEDGEMGDEGDMMNWPHLGRFACLPHIRRPAVPGFLLGPLSVEKKARRITKRSAPFRPDNLTETRPEVLNVDDMAKRENDLTAICGRILQQLQKVQLEAQETVAGLIQDDMEEEETTRVMHEHGLRSTGGIDLMRFVVNPWSFGQTVENIFYVSFLIRDARVEIDFDEFDLPSVAPVSREADDEGRARHGASKHQAILSIDEKIWRDIIETFKITEPLIPHRRESSQPAPGARGWYS